MTHRQQMQVVPQDRVLRENKGVAEESLERKALPDQFLQILITIPQHPTPRYLP